MAIKKRKEETSSQSTEKDNTFINNNTEVKNQEIVRPKIGAEGELPFIEKFVYLCIYSYFLAIAVYKIYLFPLGKFIFGSTLLQPIFNTLSL
jgi:hypothetical protein